MVVFHFWQPATEDGEKKESCAEERHEQKPNAEIMELLTLLEKYPAVMLTLLVRNGDPNQELGFKNLCCIVSHANRTICLALNRNKTL